MRLLKNTRAVLASTALLFSLPAGLLAQTNKAEEPKPKLIKVIPDAVYANETDFLCPLYQVTVVGENLPAGDALKVFVNDRQLKVVQVNEDGPPRKPAARPKETSGEEKSAEEKEQPLPQAYVQNPGDGSQFDLWINGAACYGVVELRVGINSPATPAANTTVSSPAPAPTSAASPTPRVIKSNKLSLTLAQHGNTSYGHFVFCLLVFGLAVFILILPIILIRKMIRSQIAAENSGEAASYGRRRWFEQYLTALFLDRETATYSLSKFQFYIWTAVSVVAYLYLAASRSWVQGVWSFIAIPENLPGIVFISGATGAMAMVATNSRGPKGAGDVHPSLADFVSSGGVVAVERVQFLLWTVIGALMFLWLSVVQSPVGILELPKVPESFLQLMGISSLGYLGGKFARKAGPIINDVSVKLGTFTPPKKEGAPAPTARPATILTLRGRILSPDADFKITYAAKDKNTPGKEVSLTDHFAPLDVKVVESDDQTTTREKTAKKLEITVDQPNLEWLDGATKLLISNPDGQTAGWAMPRLPKITGDIKAERVAATTATPPSPQLLKLTLTGENLARIATYVIDTKPVTKDQLPPAGIKVLTPDEDPPAEFASSLELTISNPDATWIGVGKHKLTIKNSEEMTAEGAYEIAAKPPAAPPPPTQPAGTPNPVAGNT